MNTSEGTEIKDAQDALGESVATVVGEDKSRNDFLKSADSADNPEPIKTVTDKLKKQVVEQAKSDATESVKSPLKSLRKGKKKKENSLSPREPIKSTRSKEK